MIDVSPLKGGNVRQFLEQFEGKVIRLSAVELQISPNVFQDQDKTPVTTAVKTAPKCGHPICKSFGWCQGHLPKEDT